VPLRSSIPSGGHRLTPHCRIEAEVFGNAFEYDLDPAGQSLAALREREEHRWMTCETVLALPSATVKVELVRG
jgi:hypothetical protein